MLVEQAGPGLNILGANMWIPKMEYQAHPVPRIVPCNLAPATIAVLES